MGGGGANDSCACVRKKNMLGYASPGKFCKLDALRLFLRPLSAQSGTTVIVVICMSSHA